MHTARKVAPRQLHEGTPMQAPLVTGLSQLWQYVPLVEVWSCPVHASF